MGECFAGETSRSGPRSWRSPSVRNRPGLYSSTRPDEFRLCRGEHAVSVVIPVYQGEHHLAGVLAEIAPLTVVQDSPSGVPFRIAEVFLVHDRGPDDSARVIRELAEMYDFIRPIWLSRNF